MKSYEGICTENRNVRKNKAKLIPDLDEDRLHEHIDIGDHLILIEKYFPRFKSFDRSPGRSILVSVTPFDFRIAALAKYSTLLAKAEDPSWNAIFRISSNR